MSATGLDAFDKTLQITNTWLDEIMADHGPYRQTAWHILSAVLRATRDKLPVDLAAHLGAQLPLLVRGAYYDQFQPAKQPSQIRSQDEFLAKVQENLHGIRPVNAGEAVKSVYRVLNHHIDPGQAQKVREALNAEIRTLWPDQLAA
jgi:uncharacterized protein (DUF2267 family)